MVKRLTPLVIVIVILAAAASAAGAQASSASQAFPLRGEGAAAISGYVVSGLAFILDEDPAWIGAVEFDLDAPAEQALLGVDAAPGTVFPCANPYRTHWVCALEGVGTREAGSIWISASG